VTDLDDRAEILAPGRTRDIEFAEMAVLGTAITWQHAAEEILSALNREDCFATTGHEAVFAAIRHLAENGRPVQPATVLGRLVEAEQGVWKTGQAGVIIGNLMSHATPLYEEHVATVLRAARQRWTVNGCRAALSIASRPGFDAAGDGELVRKAIDAALDGTTAPDSAVTAADLFMSAVERLESSAPPGQIQFPWAELRRYVPYLRPGQLVTIAARPSLGKSLMAQDLARYVGLRKRIPCVLFTLEQDRDEVMDRLIAAEAGVLLERIIGKDLDAAAWTRIAAAKERFEESRLVIDDTPKATPGHIRTRLRAMARSDPAQLAIIDYLQLMGTPAGAENRQQEVTALVGNLKAIAREFRIPLVMCCQLNRGPEQRHDKRPHLSDARESGSVDNDSDVAILIHREDFYEPESSRAGEADFLVDKNRNGPRGTATVGFQGNYARFVDPQWTPTSSLENR